MIKKTDSFKRLEWACRRGMLELDVLLGCYLREVFHQASADDQMLFIQLLTHNDQDLFNWLTGKQQAEDNDVRVIVDKIRQHAKTRH